MSTNQKKEIKQHVFITQRNNSRGAKKCYPKVRSAIDYSRYYYITTFFIRYRISGRNDAAASMIEYQNKALRYENRSVLQPGYSSRAPKYAVSEEFLR